MHGDERSGSSRPRLLSGDCAVLVRRRPPRGRGMDAFGLVGSPCVVIRRKAPPNRGPGPPVGWWRGAPPRRRGGGGCLVGGGRAPRGAQPPGGPRQTGAGAFRSGAT